MNLIFIGPQASGKGTQAKVIASRYKLCHVSTGDLLRNATGEAKAQIDALLKGGNLVPDEVVVSLLKERMTKTDCANGVILDGFPRTLEQAKTLDSFCKIDKVVEISLSDEEAVKRLETRRSCVKCGAVFNTITNPPKKEGVCDNCNSEIVKRADDEEKAIRKRLETYHKLTSPVLEYYKNKLVTIDGEQAIAKVSEDVVKAVF